MNLLLTNVMQNMSSKIFKKKDGNDQIIVAIVLIVIAILVAVVFKDQLSTLVKNLASSISTKITTILG